MMQPVATIVVLNGTSSSGKTTVARAFQEVAGSIFLNFSIDSILYTLPQSALRTIVEGRPVPGKPFSEIVAAYYGCVKELADRGHDLVIDNAITAEYQARHLKNAVEGHDVLYVLVSCSPEILAERERARGDREPGLAAKQLTTIEKWLDYDLRVDTSAASAEENAARIAATLTTLRERRETRY